MFGRNLANRRKRAVQLLSCFFFLPAFGFGGRSAARNNSSLLAMARSPQRNELPQPPQKQPLLQAAALLSCLRASNSSLSRPLGGAGGELVRPLDGMPHPPVRSIAEGWPPLAHRRQLEMVAGRERAVSQPKGLQGLRSSGKDVEMRRTRQLERGELDKQSP
jgi:hypothetical protein